MFTSLKLYTGQEINTQQLLSDLVAMGYKRQEEVKEEGDIARRGGVLDIFAYTFELPIRIEFDEDKVLTIKTFNFENGSVLDAHTMAIILPFRKSQSFKSLVREDVPLENFLDLKPGDLVVHTQHGVGRFLGFEKIRSGNDLRDHAVIEYDRKEKLFVPFDSMHLVQKYVAFYAKRPKLHRLGSKEWGRIKERTKKGIQKMAWDLLTLEAMRRSMAGHAFAKDTQWQQQFEATFPYQETPGQQRAMQEVKQDMEASYPMDRLLCGDVGYGKTEVAMRAAFKAVMDNKQVAFLVPTTILAEQHFHNLNLRIKDFPVRIDLLCRLKTEREQQQIASNLALGATDIVVGTHRLLSDDIRFKDLGLIIIDEEQRFGVKAKEKLKAMRLTCDVLTLTATPIPRTLYMSLMAAKELSIINTPPQNRLPIKTVVVEYDEELIRDAIVKELDRQGQVYFVHNRIEDIESVARTIGRLLPPGTRCAIGHGQMPARMLERVMQDFLEHKIDVLFCTMIIESGIDIPNVNTIIVDEAHCFGLSDLHQLRGRVGRFTRHAFAYLLIPKHEAIDSAARRRLEALQEHTQLGAGFAIAMEDLEMRGAGNLLGIQQHGFIANVGFDLYCRLLREAIGSFKKSGVFDYGAKESA